MKLLSVIVPVYNSEKYIKQCVDSILAQTYSDMEVILVDDGSADHGGVICDGYAEKFGHVIAIHQTNSGVTNARLNGVLHSRGEFITFVDADDWIAEDAYQDIMAENCSDVLVTGICRYFDENYQIMQRPSLKKGTYGREDILDKILPVMLWDSRLNGWALDPSLNTKIFKREIILNYLEKASEVKSHYGDDMMVIFPMMCHVKCLQISEKIYYYHRQRGSGVIAPYIQDERFIPKLCKVYNYLEREFKKAEYWDIMKEQLDYFFINGIDIKKRCYKYPHLEFAVYFPVNRIPKGSKVVLYGAGEVGRQYRAQNSRYDFCNIVSWVDQNYKDKQAVDCRIESPETIKVIEFDYILIAVDEYYCAREIAAYLDGCGVGKEKIVWHSVREDLRELRE